MARILITDDHNQVRDVLRVVLQSEGHEVHEAADGNEPILACQQCSFDLLFCDLFMPGKEGLETIKDVRREFPNLKVVAMSGGSPYGGGVDFLHFARLLGADAVLPKPFNRQDILAAIDKVFCSPGGLLALPDPCLRPWTRRFA